MTTPPPAIQPWLLFQLTYRDKFMAHDVFIYAHDLPEATLIGKAYCSKSMPPLQYVKVKPMVVADPRILEPGFELPPSL